MSTANNILNQLADDYNYKTGVNMQLDKIIETIKSRFDDFEVDEMHVHDTDDKEVKYTETDEDWECVNPSCSEYELFDEIGHGYCKYCQLVTKTIEKMRIEQTITSDSSIRIVLAKHVGDEKETITLNTNTGNIYINVYMKTWTTGRHPQWKWSCISQLKEVID